VDRDLARTCFKGLGMLCDVSHGGYGLATVQ
jgi:hypothetical protein